MVFGNSLVKIASSLDSFEALLSDDSGEEVHTEVPMPPPVLTNAKIQAAK